MDIADRVRRCSPEPHPEGATRERTDLAEVTPDTACYYCGDGPDSADHVYTKCAVVREARKQWGTKLGCNLKDDWAEILLAFPAVDNPVVAPGIVGFNYAVWSERSEYLPTLGYIPERASSVRRLLLQAGARLPVEKGNRGAKAEKKVADFARNPPGKAWNYFTDGSALGNPGPCGGGYVVRAPGKENYSEAVFPHGHGDNNKGEMGGIMGALLHVQKGLEGGTVESGEDVYIFSDSALCIGYLDRGWHFANWVRLAQSTRKLLRELRKTIKIIFYWIRGHSKIPGNELADAAAKKAAKLAEADINGSSSRRRVGVNLPAGSRRQEERALEKGADGVT
jgi:ribonuclease HI